ncbi:N-acetylglucosamine-6-phosphate deacetylase [Risungbinella massiliensis]|uniref:N-acetylglucosamine-6-phosphate deacetylase n=1 Tax=Risungbinella massiliensis TaxID=1329796 RepID=UPI0005CC141D|nr:N-acetylglucosamine-6-phosphate deacetylase [Risungbinella massiliensis]
MGKIAWTHANIYTEVGWLTDAYLLTEGGKIQEIGEMTHYQGDADQTISLEGKGLLLPGMIDVHIHGTDGADTMDATPEALTTMAKALGQEGTTSFLATTITQEKEAISRALANAADFIETQPTSGQAECLGIHLEGPFINPKMAGAQPIEHITPPDIFQMKEWQEIAKNHIRLITMAPEEENALDLIRYLAETGVVASIGHTSATYQQVREAIAAGATHVTHLYNQMRGLHHREPGVVGAAMLSDELMVEMIVDGIHIDPKMVKLAYDQISADRTVLVTDSMRAKCLRNGKYDLGGQEVTVENGEARLSNGSLAGSILKMKDAIWHMREFAGASLEELVQISSTNAAKELGVWDRKGSIAVGKDADFVWLTDELELEMTVSRGEISYQRSTETTNGTN